MAINMGFPTDGVENQGWKLYLTSLIMILSAGLFVIARVLTRVRIFQLKADDYAIIASLAFSIYLSVTIQLAVVHGYGKHVRDLSKAEMRTCLKFFWLAQTPYKIVVCLNKISVILLYMRIFIAQHFRWLCFCALGIIVSSGIATVFATIFQCVPIERSWNKAIDGTCIDSSMFWVANAVINISTDVIVLALPIREISRLQLKFREKIMLHSVFLLGSFVTVTSILRVTAVANSVHNQKDQTWNFIQRGVWTLIEANLGIICACLIVLRQPFARFLSTVFGTTKPSTSRGYRYGRSGSGAVMPTIGSANRVLRNSSSRQRIKLDDTIDYDCGGTDVRNPMHRTDSDDAWTGHAAYNLTSLARSGASDTSRKSDERHIVPAHDTKEHPTRISVDSTDEGLGWPLDNEMGITKQVDIEVTSHPSTPHN